MKHMHADRSKIYLIGMHEKPVYTADIILHQDIFIHNCTIHGGNLSMYYEGELEYV